MNETWKRLWLVLITVGSAAMLLAGWKLFWFLTDDAFIAFRYVSNSLLGHGYMWNPPPFIPVEGYTSFLWVVLLDGIWRLTGLEPPQVVNSLSLFFSGLTLLLVGWAVMRMRLSESLHRFRLLFLALTLLGTLSNRTFLAWTSSGLETAMFNFFFTAWMIIALMGRKKSRGWLLGLTATAALAYLTRPDGILVLLSTLLLVILALILRYRRIDIGWRGRLTLTPLLVPIIHLIWRRLTYGEWLPNTYYAKYVAAWPEAGLRYLASFILEYGLWVWLLVLLWLAVREVRRTVQTDRGRLAGLSAAVRGLATRPDSASEQSLAPVIIVGTVAAHIAYYSLIIGGDHFEYRVFSYLIPLAFVSAVWMLNRLVSDPVVAAAVLGLFIVLSWPLPWTHWALTKDLDSRGDTWILRMPVAQEFPVGLKWYARSFDRLQIWLIERHICMRHQEHKVFYEYFSDIYPARSHQKIPRAGEYPTMFATSVGIPGWVFPQVAVVDGFGLNDYVVARHPTVPRKHRLMAHDRSAPRGYWRSYAINYGLLVNESAGFVRRDFELTAEEIIANQKFWIDRVIHGSEASFTYRMLCRVGESYNRHSRFDSATIWFSDAIALDSLNSRAYIGMAKGLVDARQFDSALSLLTRADRLEPGSPLIASRLGAAYATRGYDLYDTDSNLAYGGFATAEDYLTAAIGPNIFAADALVELASLNLFLDRTDSSAVFLSLLESSREPSPRALHLLGERYLFKERADLALRAFSLAIRNGLNPAVKQALVRAYPQLRANNTAAD